MLRKSSSMTEPVCTGINALEKVIGQIQGGEILLLSGRPGMGQAKLLHYFAQYNNGTRMIFADIPASIHEREQYVRALKKLSGAAKEMNVPLIVTFNVSRSVENREDMRPTLNDLGEAGKIADYVICVYRDFYYNYDKYDHSTTDGDNETELIVVKCCGKPVYEKLIFKEKIDTLCNIK